MSKKKGNEGQAANDQTATMETANPASHFSTPESQAAMTGSDGETRLGSEPKESKRERFRRLATARLPKAIKRIEQIRSLANKSQYEFSAAQVEWLIGNLYAACEQAAQAFQGVKASEKKLVCPE